MKTLIWLVMLVWLFITVLLFPAGNAHAQVMFVQTSTELISAVETTKPPSQFFVVFQDTLSKNGFTTMMATDEYDFVLYAWKDWNHSKSVDAQIRVMGQGDGIVAVWIIIDILDGQDGYGIPFFINMVRQLTIPLVQIQRGG